MSASIAGTSVNVNNVEKTIAADPNKQKTAYETPEHLVCRLLLEKKNTYEQFSRIGPASRRWSAVSLPTTVFCSGLQHQWEHLGTANQDIHARKSHGKRHVTR